MYLMDGASQRVDEPMKKLGISQNIPLLGLTPNFFTGITHTPPTDS